MVSKVKKKETTRSPVKLKVRFPQEKTSIWTFRDLSCFQVNFPFVLTKKKDNFASDKLHPKKRELNFLSGYVNFLQFRCSKKKDEFWSKVGIEKKLSYETSHLISSLHLLHLEIQRLDLRSTSTLVLPPPLQLAIAIPTGRDFCHIRNLCVCVFFSRHFIVFVFVQYLCSLFFVHLLKNN